jgi:hypothetical protein
LVDCGSLHDYIFYALSFSSWNKVLNWNQGLARGLEDYRALEEDHSLKILYMPGTSIPELSISNVVWDSMDNEIRERLPQVAQRFPVLAVWQIFAISQEAEHFINDMGRVASLENFCYDKCLTTWHKTAPNGNIPYTPDATSTSWGIPVVTLSEIPRISTSSASLPSEAAPSRNDNLSPAQVKINPDLTPSELKEVTDQKRIRTRRKLAGHSTCDETWQNATVAGRSSSTTTCLTTSLLQHVSYSYPCSPWSV